MRSLLAPVLAACVLAVPAAALAGTGSGGVAPGASTPTTSGGGGGSPAGDPSSLPRTGARRARRRPQLVSFSVRPASLFIFGRAARVRFEIRDRSRTVHVKLLVRRPGGSRPLRTIDLGDRQTGVRQRYSLSGQEGGDLPQGDFELRLTARDRAGHRLRRSAHASDVGRFAFHWHRFPLIGNFVYGNDPGGRFGAPRPGHTHQGQDIPAPEGTPVVAPRGGTIKVVAYQAEGAGNYVVLDGRGEDRDYVFMHLRNGSVVVRQGQRVLTGQRIGDVGSTGESSGPHLHFEVWEGGGWYTGGHPVDPLAYLRRWDTWS